MTTMSKFLALIPVVAFAAGCNGTAPAGPSQVSNNDAIESASGDASAMARIRCTTLKSIELTINNADDSMLWVDATYHFSNGLATPCAAPVWSSNRDGLTVDKANAYRAGFFRLMGGTATLKATGPNGVQSTIQVDLNSVNNSPVPPGVCADVAKVSVTMMPVSNVGTVLLVAEYRYNGPLSTPCLIAPVWAADRRGLRVNETNPFQASIDRSTDAPTKVTATAPNGATGSTTF